MNVFNQASASSPHKIQGNIGEARAVYEYTKMGYTVLTPMTVSSKYDLVVDDGVNLLKVQVKTSRSKSGPTGYAVTLSTSGGNTKVNTIKKRQQGDYDLLFVLTEDGRCWSIPSEELGSVGHSIVVGNSKFNNCQI